MFLRYIRVNIIDESSLFQIRKSFAGATAVLPHNRVRNLHFCDDFANTETEHQ